MSYIYWAQVCMYAGTDKGVLLTRPALHWVRVALEFLGSGYKKSTSLKNHRKVWYHCDISWDWLKMANLSSCKLIKTNISHVKSAWPFLVLCLQPLENWISITYFSTWTIWKSAHSRSYDIQVCKTSKPVGIYSRAVIQHHHLQISHDAQR